MSPRAGQGTTAPQLGIVPGGLVPSGAPVRRLDLKAPHQVYTDSQGRKLPGVTTVTKRIGKEALIHWAWKEGKEGRDYRTKRDTAANSGTIAHAMIEAWLRGETLDLAGQDAALVAQAQLAFESFQGWWDGCGYSWIASELQVVNETRGYGGTLDILARVGSRVRLVDIKTSSGIYPEMRVQLGGYAGIISVPHLDNVTRKLRAPVVLDGADIVRVDKSGSAEIEVLPIELDGEKGLVKSTEAFFDTLRLHRFLEACEA